MRTVKVSLKERSYSILIGNDLLPKVGSYCSRFKFAEKCAVITDSNVAPSYAKTVVNSLKASGFDPVLVEVQAGEQSKNMRVMENCYDQLAAHRMERKSFVVALGGGVVGDLAGFVAATHLRGIGFVQVPTTLLSQVDSSVGGKVGVNLKAGKNLVGAFYQPQIVLCDLDTLKTLPLRELRAGVAEIIKYGIIYDAPLFKKLERQMDQLLALDPSVASSIIARCCAIKADVVSQDETESGLRAILNFGHTIGHALEAISGYGKYLHGEAISIGQAAAARISTNLLGFKSSEVTRVENLLVKAGLPTRVKLNASQHEKLFGAMKLDKKVSAGEVKFVLARKIGTVEFGHRVSQAAIQQALSEVAE